MCPSRRIPQRCGTKSLPLEGKVGFAQQNSDEVESYKRITFKHLITAFGGASPQGEAFSLDTCFYLYQQHLRKRNVSKGRLHPPLQPRVLCSALVVRSDKSMHSKYGTKLKVNFVYTHCPFVFLALICKPSSL